MKDHFHLDFYHLVNLAAAVRLRSDDGWQKTTCTLMQSDWLSYSYIEITSWKVRAYDFYLRVEKYRKTNE